MPRALKKALQQQRQPLDLSPPASVARDEAPVVNALNVNTGTGQVRLFSNGMEIRGVFNVKIGPSDAQKKQRAHERWELAQIVSPGQRKVQMEHARQLASDFAREFRALEVHLSEVPLNLLGKVPHPAGTDIVKNVASACSAEPCDWFSPGRMAFFVFRCPSDPHAWSRARDRLNSILEDITLSIPSVPLEAYLDQRTWWLQRIHLATLQNFYVWDGVLLTSHGTNRSGADGRWLYSKMDDFGSVMSRLLDYMVQDTGGKFWDSLGLEAPIFHELPSLSETDQKVLKVLQEAPPGEWVSRKTIAKKIDVDISTVRRSLKKIGLSGIEQKRFEGCRLSQSGR